MMMYKSIALATLILFFVACGGAGIDGTPPREYESGKQMAAMAKLGITEITPEELNEKLDSEEMFLLIDVREMDEYDEETIDGSFHLPRGQIEFKIDNERFWDDQAMYVPEKDEEIIVFCSNGRRGALATETLASLGYANVKNLAGGFLVWKYGPDAVEEEESVPESGGCG